jgi:serine/threonine protein kinase
MRQTGEVVAGFRVERLLGSGGMGEVYLVRHPRLPRLDALKVLPSAASADPSYRERFQREADLAAQLDHDNVVTVYDRGEAGGQLWIHMKYVEGQDAAAALRSGGPFGAQRALHVITKVAAALDDAHRHDLLHRDVKPANILLGRPSAPGEPERVYLSDFGIAKGVGDAAGLTPSGHFAASLDYAAPEQIQVQRLDGRADQYALGCVLFQLLTGAVPFRGDGAWARMNAHLSEPVPKVGLLRPGLPPGVQSVLDQAMAKNPRDRFRSCGDMARALRDALQCAPGTILEAGPLAVADAVLPAPREADASETPHPQPAVLPPSSDAAEPPTEALTAHAQAASPAESPIPAPMASHLSPPMSPPVSWRRQVNPAAGAALLGAIGLALVSAFPPSSVQTGSRYAGEIPSGHFAAGQLPAIVLLLVAAGLQLTWAGHRYRSLLYGIAAGAGTYALVDSLRVYAFTTSDPGGAYGSTLAQTNGAVARAALAFLVVVVAGCGIYRAPPRPRPAPGPHRLIIALLASSAVVLAAVAAAIGPALQSSRWPSLGYGLPFAPTLIAALLLGEAARSRRVPMLAAAVTVTLAAALAGIVAPDPLHYPIALAGDALLLAAAGVLVVAARRPAVSVGVPDRVSP